MRSFSCPGLVFGIVIVLLLCIPCMAGSAADQPPLRNSTPVMKMPDGPSDPVEVEAFLDSAMPANLARNNVPGSTVAVVKDGGLVLAKGYGYSDIGNKTPVVADRTLFRIGSITKLFTWTAVMQLVDEGKIDLDADVNTYLKDFRIPDTYPGRPITMRHLMTHTAGFEDSEHHMTVPDLQHIVPFRKYCADNTPARVWPPGTVSSYSNYGTTLAGVIIEDVTGMPYEEYLQSRIISPLGMDQTSIREDLPPYLKTNLSQGYLYSGTRNMAVPDDIYVIAPAGTISSTAPDMARFLAAHMQDGTYRNTTILPADAAQLMHARAFANDPRVSGMCLGFYEMHINNRRLIVHGGDTHTFHSLLAIIPEEQAGFFVSYNSMGGNKARDELLVEFMDHYYPADSGSIPQPDPSAASLLNQYEGTYEINRHNFAHFEKYLSPAATVEVTVSPEGALLMPHGGEVLELVEIEPGVFTRLDGTKPASGDIIFHTGTDGTVEFFESYNTPILVFERVPWYATSGFTDNLRTAAALIIATVLLWPLLYAFRRAYRIPEPKVSRRARIARWTAESAALMLLAFVFVLLPQVVSDQALIESYMADPAVPAVMTAIFSLPVIAAFLTLAIIIFTVLAWKDQYWTVVHRVHYTAVAAGLAAMLWWVNFNNLWVWCL